jgi:hypothetical protein
LGWVQPVGDSAGAPWGSAPESACHVYAIGDLRLRLLYRAATRGSVPMGLRPTKWR